MVWKVVRVLKSGALISMTVWKAVRVLKSGALISMTVWNAVRVCTDQYDGVESC